MKYYIQEIADNYLKNLVQEPEAISVVRSFLHGLDINEFEEGYIALLRLIRSLYTDIKNDPGAFGMPLIEAVEDNPKNTDYTKSHDGFKRVPNILLVLGTTGTLSSKQSLIINGKELIAAAKNVKIVKMPELLNKLIDYGFEIKGYNKTVKDTDELTIDYPDCRAMLPVLKSMADIQKEIGKGDLRRNNAYFYMMMPEILAASKIKEPVLKLDHMLQALSKNNEIIAKKFNDCINGKAKIKVRTIDFMRNRWHAVYTGIKSKQALCTLRNEQNEMSVKLNLEHINDYIDVVMKIPDKLQNDIRNGAWSCNQSECNPKCAGGFKFEIDGIAYNKCRGGAFTFTNISTDEASYLIKLLELEMKRED